MTKEANLRVPYKEDVVPVGGTRTSSPKKKLKTKGQRSGGHQVDVKRREKRKLGSDHQNGGERVKKRDGGGRKKTSIDVDALNAEEELAGGDSTLLRRLTWERTNWTDTQKRGLRITKGSNEKGEGPSREGLAPVVKRHA